MVRYSGTVPGNNPSYVIDGNPTTCCLAAEYDDRLRSTTFAWLQIDLGATFSVASVTLTNTNTGKFFITISIIIWNYYSRLTNAYIDGTRVFTF